MTEDVLSGRQVQSEKEATSQVSVAEGNASGWMEDDQRRQEYKAAGIDCDDKDGAWMWNGKPVYWLVVENGSMYQNDSASEEKIYILVKRDTDGTILEAKQITVEEVIAAHILEKEQKKETQRQAIEKENGAIISLDTLQLYLLR